MKQEFTLKKEEYYKTRKRLISSLFGFMLYFTTLMWGIFYFTGTEIPMPSRWIDGYFIFLFVLTTSFPFLNELSKAKTAYKTYRIIFDDHTIQLKQLGTWNSLMQKLFFFKPRYIINKRQIPYKEVIAIEKSKNGSFIIKGQRNSYPNTLILSPHVEHAKDLEIALSEIRQISHYSNSVDSNATIFKNLPQKLFNTKHIFSILGIYLVILLFAYFWFSPINWPLAAFLSAIILLPTLGFIWGFRKTPHGIYSLFMDDTRIIIEHRNGQLKAISFNQITAIGKKSNNQLIILTNHVNSSMSNLTVIPNTLENFERLEQKLNVIHPITYTNKKRNAALDSND